MDDNRHRRSIRLRGYDYTRSGAYFVTICAQNRECLFGDINERATIGDCPYGDHGNHPGVILNDAGEMVQTVWHEIPSHYPGVGIDEFVVMPNHVHGIFIIGHPQGGAPTGIKPDSDVGRGKTRLSLPDVIHRFKTMTTKRYADGVKQNGWARFTGRLWQRNYWEHIVRNESELNRIREYIRNNPAQWESDRLRNKSGQYPGHTFESRRYIGETPWTA